MVAYIFAEGYSSFGDEKAVLWIRVVRYSGRFSIHVGSLVKRPIAVLPDGVWEAQSEVIHWRVCRGTGSPQAPRAGRRTAPLIAGPSFPKLLASSSPPIARSFLGLIFGLNVRLKPDNTPKLTGNAGCRQLNIV